MTLPYHMLKMAELNILNESFVYFILPPYNWTNISNPYFVMQYYRFSLRKKQEKKFTESILIERSLIEKFESPNTYLNFFFFWILISSLHFFFKYFLSFRTSAPKIPLLELFQVFHTSPRSMISILKTIFSSCKACFI